MKENELQNVERKVNNKIEEEEKCRISNMIIFSLTKLKFSHWYDLNLNQYMFVFLILSLMLSIWIDYATILIEWFIIIFFIQVIVLILEFLLSFFILYSTYNSLMWSLFSTRGLDVGNWLCLFSTGLFLRSWLSISFWSVYFLSSLFQILTKPWRN